MNPPHKEQTATPVKLAPPEQSATPESSEQPRGVRTSAIHDRTGLVREILAVFAMVLLCDLTIYRGEGFAGLAILFIATPILLRCASSSPARRGWSLTLGIMLALLGLRILWCGFPWMVGLGFCLIASYAMTLAGRTPQILDATLFAAQIVPAGFCGLELYLRQFSARFQSKNPSGWATYGLPLIVAIVFGTVFVLANPDLVTSFSKGFEWFVDELHDWLVYFSIMEFLFCFAALWFTVGLVRPLSAVGVEATGDDAPTHHLPGPSGLFGAFRNTLVTVIVLFAIYLVFEFKTLWFRRFPEGFYYSGYAHEGAAWLTLALALSTMTLSLIFQGRILEDARQYQLRRLAWLWSLENLVLALAVFNRLFIYIGFNGMTRMRTIGLFGISTVVAGFVLVLIKMARNRSFLWLIRGQLAALAIAVYLFALTPVDSLVVHYNVRRILRGDPAPSVQISVHPISDEGFHLLTPLLKVEDPLIRDGAAAMLASRLNKVGGENESDQHWTEYQISRRNLFRQLDARKAEWSRYEDGNRRRTAIRAFREYAYQWY